VRKTESESEEELLKKMRDIICSLDASKKELHKVRLKNMQLREAASKLSSQVTLLQQDKDSLRQQVATLEKKSANDCNTILD